MTVAEEEIQMEPFSESEMMDISCASTAPALDITLICPEEEELAQMEASFRGDPVKVGDAGHV